MGRTESVARVVSALILLGICLSFSTGTSAKSLGDSMSCSVCKAAVSAVDALITVNTTEAELKVGFSLFP